jgi:hypothetical protein
MLSIDLFATQFERELREGAVDDLEYRRMTDLREKMEMLMQAYKKADTDEVRQAIMKRYNEYKAERESYMKVREQQVPSKQDAFAYVKPEPRGIGDIQDPKDKMAQLAQRAKKGPLANVGAGIRAFIKGEPEPMDEQQELGRRGIGMANMKALQATVEKGFARTIFQFPSGKFVVGEDDTDKMADYYNALDSAGRTNFVYNILGDGMRFVQMCKELGIQADAVQPTQPELPGMPNSGPQGELPLGEARNQKKKSKEDDIATGDVKVARELQKLRAQYPAAKSDVEAVARAEIDSTERSQQQLAAIRGANEKQDALLKQLVALDQEQGREINTLDKENDSLEKQLDQVQTTNAALAQTVSQMTGTKKSARPIPPSTGAQPARTTIDLIPGAPADKQKVVPMREPVAQPDEKTVVAPTDQLPDIKTAQEVPTNVVQFSKYAPPEQLVKAKKEPKKVSGSDIQEHGGGIGPRKHWQSMMPEGQPQEAIRRYLAIDAETDVEAVRAAIQAISRDPALTDSQKSRYLGYIFALVGKHRLLIGRPYYQFLQRYMEDINETALNPKDLKGDYEAKRRALHDLSLNKNVDQQAVLQRRLDLDREAKAKELAETVTNVKAGMAEIYRRLAPRIERHRDSFLAGQLYDELENYAELHGAEGEFKRMMSTARNRAHMEYDTNPGGFHNWFWFLPFEDDAMAEGWSDKHNPTPYSVYIDGREWRAFKDDEHARAVAQKVQANLERQGRKQTVTIAPSKTKKVQEGQDNKLDLASKEFIQGVYDPAGPVYRAAYKSFPKGQQAEAILRKHIAQKYGVREKDLIDAMSNHVASRMAGRRYKKQDNVDEQFGMPGTSIPRKSVIQGYTVFFNPKTQMVSVTRGGDSEEAAIEQAKVGTPSLKNFRQAADRLIDRIESDLTENLTREPRTARERDEMIDKIRRMMKQDRNPANLQIMKKDIEILQTRYRDLKEDSDSGEAVEMAIMRRMLVAHTDLIVEFGLDKVVQAIEEVAYNVGDTDEIGSSDVSGWVNQVKQILGVDA